MEEMHRYPSLIPSLQLLVTTTILSSWTVLLSYGLLTLVIEILFIQDWTWSSSFPPSPILLAVHCFPRCTTAGTTTSAPHPRLAPPLVLPISACSQTQLPHRHLRRQAARHTPSLVHPFPMIPLRRSPLPILTNVRARIDQSTRRAPR